MRLFRLVLLCGLMAAALVLPRAAAQQITPEQRQEMAAVGRDLGEAAKLLRKKEYAEAQTLLDAAEAKLDALGLPPTDRLAATLKRNIALRRRALALAQGAKPADLGASFSKDVAPIIEANCLKCHGAADPKGGLRLDTFAGWKAGGASKRPIIVIGNAQFSPLIQRLVVPTAQRMPKDGPPLAPAEIQTIARWVAEGAKFDGKAEDAAIGEMADGAKGGKPAEEPVMIAKPKGTETVSFTKDVAPFFVNICGQCHFGNDPRGGYSMATFEGIMRGGDSGQVIESGDPDASRLWLMVSNKEQPRMPPGQLRITRPNYDALTTWIKEGAVFDGNDAKKPLRDLVPSAAEMAADNLAKLTPQEWETRRQERTLEQWSKAFPKDSPAQAETANVLVYGNVSEARLKTVAGWADEQATALRSLFKAPAGPLWKGKLAVFVIKDRFGYEEFSLVIDRRPQVPAEVHGHAVVTPDYGDAYAVLEDTGDAASAAGPGLKAMLANQMTQAYLQREGGKAPNWLMQGTGMYVAAQSSDDKQYFTDLRRKAAEAIGTIARPEQVFADGTFPPGEATAVGYAVVDFLILQGGQAKFGPFLAAVAKSGDVDAAVQGVYRTTTAQLATAFLQNLAVRR